MDICILILIVYKEKEIGEVKRKKLAFSSLASESQSWHLSFWPVLLLITNCLQQQFSRGRYYLFA